MNAHEKQGSTERRVETPLEDMRLQNEFPELVAFREFYAGAAELERQGQRAIFRDKPVTTAELLAEAREVVRSDGSQSAEARQFEQDCEAWMTHRGNTTIH